MENNLSAILEKLESDSELRERLEVLKSLPLQERREGFLTLSTELGMPVSIADLKDFASQGEISDASLEGVAGGVGTPQKPKGLEAAPHHSVIKGFLAQLGINL